MPQNIVRLSDQNRFETPIVEMKDTIINVWIYKLIYFNLDQAV